MNYLLEHIRIKKFFWIVFLFLGTGSCLDEPDCVNMNNGFVGISFKKMFDNKADTVVFIGIQSPESDSIFYSYTRATAISLPLNSFATQTRYDMEGVYGSKFVELGYVNKSTQYVSEDCGVRYVFSDLKLLGHNFDSVKVITTDLFSTVQPNLEAYRCPRTNLVKIAFRQLIGPTERADTVFLNTISADYPTQFYIPEDTLSTLNLPLNQNSSSTTFYFGFKDGSSRSITFNYTRTSWDEFDTWCGSLTRFSELSSTVYDFNDVQIRKDSAQDPPVTNAAIFK